MGPLKSTVMLTRTAGAARVLEVLSYAAAGLWLLATLVLIPRLADFIPVEANHRTFGILAAVVLGALGANVFGALGELYGQRARDIFANEVFAAIRRGEKPKPFSLYLRPFASTNVISATGGFIGFVAERVELEGQVERATRPIGGLVALGAPLEHIGAGRIQVPDTEWRAAIDLLLKHARLIVMLPSSRQGTLEEISMILGSDLVTRTVLIDPPNLGSSKHYDHAREWAKLQQVFSKAQFELPAEERRGALLYYGSRRKPLLRERLDIDAEDRIQRLFKRTLKYTRRARA